MEWIKLRTDIFEDEKIKLILASGKRGNDFFTVWVKLLALAGKQNNSGVFMVDKLRLTDLMLADVTNTPKRLMQEALSMFCSYGMIEKIDGAYAIQNWEKHQSLKATEARKEKDRERQRSRRDRQKQIANNSCDESDSVTPTSHDLSRDCHGTVTEKSAPRNKNKDIYIRNKEKGEKKGVTCHAENAPAPSEKQQCKKIYFGNVFLTEKESDDLKSRYPDHWEDLIQHLSDYITETGKRYANHYNTILRWAKKDNIPTAADSAKKTYDVDDFFEAAVKKSMASISEGDAAP